MRRAAIHRSPQRRSTRSPRAACCSVQPSLASPDRQFERQATPTLRSKAMEYVALGMAVFAGGIVSGFAGFAFSAVAGAILLHFLPPMQAIPLMMMCSIASQMTSIAMLRKCVVWNESAFLLIGGVLGVPIALYLLTLIQPNLFRIGFGIFLASYALYMLVKPVAAAGRVGGGPVTSSIVGFVGGFLGGLTAMPGALPAIWCDLRGVQKEHQRGVVQPFILGMQVFALA